MKLWICKILQTFLMIATVLDVAPKKFLTFEDWCYDYYSIYHGQRLSLASFSYCLIYKSTAFFCTVLLTKTGIWTDHLKTSRHPSPVEKGDRCLTFYPWLDCTDIANQYRHRPSDRYRVLLRQSGRKERSISPSSLRTAMSIFMNGLILLGTMVGIVAFRMIWPSLVAPWSGIKILIS